MKSPWVQWLLLDRFSVAECRWPEVLVHEAFEAARPTRWRKFLSTTLALVLNALLVTGSWAGPPLSIDDPGILEPGSWEIIAAINGEKRSAGTLINAPLLDVSLGLTKATQLSLSTSYTVIDPNGAATESGLNVTTIGYKWRVASSGRWEAALAANYAFVVSHELIPKNTTNDVRTLGLPIVVSYRVDSWTWYGQAGWNIDSDNNRSLDFGLAISHPLLDSTEWLMEIGGTSSKSLDDHSLFFNLGLDHEIGQEMHLLVSAGSRLGPGPDPDDKLDLAFFIGLQWFK